MKRRIMVLGASILQAPAIEKAQEMGLEVIAVDMDKNAIGFKKADICLPISTIDIPAVVDAAKKYHVNGVMTLASDIPMRTVAAVAKACGLIGIDDETALRATNKAVMRQILQDKGVPIPEFHKVNCKNEYDDVTADFAGKGIKYIVKPADNSGSRGIFLVENQTDVDANEAAFHHSKRFSRGGDIIVEEYMEGPEVSVETLSVDGKCHVIQITDKLTTGAPFFVEMGHSQPSQLSSDAIDDIRNVAMMAVEAIGIKNGPSHTEIKVTKSGAKIVELGARLGGDCITTHLVPLSTGVDLVKCCILIALGEKCDYAAKWKRGSAIRYFDTHAGILRKVTGIDYAMSIDGIQEIEIVKEIGQPVNDIESSTDRVGFVISQMKTAAEAIQQCDLAKKRIQIEID